MAGFLVTVLLLSAAVLLGILSPILPWLGLIMLTTGHYAIVLLLLGLTVVIPGSLAVVALRLLNSKHPIAACLVAALSSGLELFVFLVISRIR